LIKISKIKFDTKYDIYCLKYKKSIYTYVNQKTRASENNGRIVFVPEYNTPSIGPFIRNAFVTNNKIHLYIIKYITVLGEYY
jgi:hypothetical protein